MVTTTHEGSLGHAQDDASVMLRCTDLRKSYDTLQAVDGVSFEIRTGETYGLLGPNGAGKTTLISMVAGVLEGDGGEVTLDGLRMDPSALDAKALIGYVPQDVALYPDLTARENLRFFASLYKLGRQEARARVAEVLEVVGLSERADDQVKTYSGGMKRRLNIGAGLIHRPRLLILDEPTVGVDPQSRNAILDSIEALSAEGMAVLYTTHYMEEAERLCDRVGIVDLGHLIAEGPPRALTSELGEAEHIIMAVEGDLAAAVAAVDALAVAGTTTGEAGVLDVLVADAESALPLVMGAAMSAGATIRSVNVQEPDLEVVFLHLTGKRLRD
ncbi:MAG TPA: ABC transporter ATP-binding protein [Nocardioidaceae bacterium]|nr:ABC transporter ATP-binding protein [Nocardioidaceae bacterium]